MIYELYVEAGAPSLETMAAVVAADDDLPGAPEKDTIHRIIRDTALPPSQADVVAVVTVLARATTTWDSHDAAQRARDLWVAARMSSAVGVPLGEASDPFVLEVHRPIAAEQAGTLPPLPPYLPRPHDQQLAAVVQRAAEGASMMTVLVAGSSAGKTRACWQALEPLRKAGGWRLWHPFDPTRPQAALQDLDRVGPRTVVWLNETQDYLGGGEAGERVAAGLRTLLADRARAPVLVLGTLWPEHHTDLTRRPESQVRQLLDGTIIEVPETFTGTDPAVLRQAATTDPRLAEAIEHAEDGQITQYLAGGPELLARFTAAEPAAKAMIWAAMDARRMGHRNALPLSLLEEAVPAYLTATQYDQLGEDWLERALAYTAQPCKGARGPVTRIRAERPHRGRRRHTPHASGHDGGPVYQLADYLDQHGRATRADQIPPIGFWEAAAAHAHPSDQRALGDAAWNRGLYRDATQLHKNATTHGDPWAARSLVAHLHRLHPTDHRPAAHAAAHIALDNPYGVAALLGGLREAGAGDQVTALADRATAHAALDDPAGVAALLDRLRAAGADDQVTALADRAAAQVALDDPRGVAVLLDRLRAAGAGDQVTALLARNPAAHAALDDPRGVAVLLRGLREAGADDQVTALADRATAHAALDDPRGVAVLLPGLRAAGADDQVTALADRATAHAALDDPFGLAALLDRLRAAGADDQVTALLARNPAAHAALDDLGGVAVLLRGLREAGAGDQVTALADRLPAAGMFDQFLQFADHRERYRFGREPEGHPADWWRWEDLLDLG
ncbi:hypothetical protein [Actinomadura fibrosa]|uniref:ATP-binding protein n=1 Tax=Actinomadura fibrosa TaxID=111802 RepID=A0ABW2XMI5_9ACTN|nr:hypothetical protein [Actinomadura fibrosa]